MIADEAPPEGTKRDPVGLIAARGFPVRRRGATCGRDFTRVKRKRECDIRRVVGVGRAEENPGVTCEGAHEVYLDLSGHACAVLV